LLHLVKMGGRLLLKNKLMKEFIIKPIDINRITDIKSLIESLNQSEKFIVCLGKEKVGRTALSFKLLNGLLSDEHRDWKPLFVCMDKPSVYQYWQGKFKEMIEDKKVLERFERIPFIYPLENEQPFDYLTATIKEYKPALIIVDGYDNLLKLNESEEDKRLIIKLYFIYSFLNRFFLENKTTILITWQNSYGINRKKYEGVNIEYWELERPEYMGEYIQEYGDTRLKIME